MIEDIKAVIDLLPNNIVGSIKKTHHFFYGNDSTLKNIKENIDNVNIMYVSDDTLVIEMDVIINTDNLLELYTKFKELSSRFKVDYDGFEVIIEENKKEFLPIEDFF